MYVCKRYHHHLVNLPPALIAYNLGDVVSPPSRRILSVLYHHSKIYLCERIFVLRVIATNVQDPSKLMCLWGRSAPSGDPALAPRSPEMTRGLLIQEPCEHAISSIQLMCSYISIVTSRHANNSSIAVRNKRQHAERVYGVLKY